MLRASGALRLPALCRVGPAADLRGAFPHCPSRRSAAAGLFLNFCYPADAGITRALCLAQGLARFWRASPCPGGASRSTGRFPPLAVILPRLCRSGRARVARRAVPRSVFSLCSLALCVQFGPVYGSRTPHAHRRRSRTRHYLSLIL